MAQREIQGAQIVVVGAGSAGCVIAARVTERSDRTVSLLEAGVDYAPEALPEDLRDGSRNSLTHHDWGYGHSPNHRRWRTRFPRGRVVGGSSAVNTCIALRGQPADYDEWAARGLPSWSWSKCLPAFRRLERDLDFGHETYHGNRGPLPLRRAQAAELVPWQAAFLQACEELGFSNCPDSNAPESHGAGPHTMNRDALGRRISAADAYLTPAVRARENLTILARMLVRRVLFRGARVVGVEVVQETSGEVSRISANTVVLCAGAISTPGILLRSGIGPRRELARLGVECVFDVPAVGARVLDHPGAAIFLRPRAQALLRHLDRRGQPRVPLIQTALRYGSRGSGRLNDMLLQPGSKLPVPGGPDLPIVVLMAAVGKPRGEGRLRFPSSDERARPLIHSRILEHPDDRRRAVEAMQLAYELARTRPLRELATWLWPSARVLRQRERMDSWILRSSDSGYHPCGTVPMGAEGALEAATDGEGRVRGVSGLRVADASLMPTIPSSNINLPTLMIGERFGEWLRRGDFD